MSSVTIQRSCDILSKQNGRPLTEPWFLHSLSLTLSLRRDRANGAVVWSATRCTEGEARWMANEAAPSRVPSSTRALTVGWSRRHRAVFQRNPTFAAHRFARDRIHGGGLYGGSLYGVGLPTSVRSSPTGRDGSTTSTVADQV
jgi:hypothetical protein